MKDERIRELRMLANEGLASDAELFECLDAIGKARELLQEFIAGTAEATEVYPKGHLYAGAYIVAVTEYERLDSIQDTATKARAFLDGDKP